MLNPESLPAIGTAPRFCAECGLARDASTDRLCDHCGATLEIQGYCPICESRLRLPVGVACPKHDVELLADDSAIRPQLPADESIAWVTVKRFPDSLAVAGARIRLEAEGIPTFVEGERMGAPSMYRVATGGVKLQVPTGLSAEARVLLDQDWAWPDEELELDDGPGQDNDPGLKERVNLRESPRALLVELVVVLTLAIPMIVWLILHYRGG